MTKKLSISFSVPKEKIKNSNAALSHIIAAQKSAWLRSFAEPIWSEEIFKQFGIKAIEPKIEDLPKINLTPEAEAIQQHLYTFQQDLEQIEKEEIELKNNLSEHKNNKTLLKNLKKQKTEFEKIVELEEKINSYDRKTLENKAAKSRLKATISNIKKTQLPSVSKELRKIESLNKKNYIKKKLELNSHQQLFTECAVIVKVHNISSHAYDSPNFYPTIKPILDAGTDTGVLWADDNNSIITGGVLFLPGEMKSRNEYVMEIDIVDDWPWKNAV